MRFFNKQKGPQLPRKTRMHSASSAYHITVRGTGQMTIFEDDDDNRHYLQLLLNAKKKHGVLIYAYCLMGNHAHIIAQADLKAISEMMHYVNGLYAEDFNERHGRNGSLFQDRFFSIPIEKESHLLEAIRYVICNPWRAGICEPWNYKWSSYREYEKSSFLTDCHLLEDEIGKGPQFRRFIEQASDSDMLFKLKHQKVNDAQAITAAKATLGIQDLAELQSMSKADRNCCIYQLRELGLPVSQTCRITGFGRGIVEKAYSPR